MNIPMKAITDLNQAVMFARNAIDLGRALRRFYNTTDVCASECQSTDSRVLACAKGCAFCCHITVGVRAQEAFVIADFVQTKFASERQHALTDRLRKHVALVSPFSVDEQKAANMPCPLLENFVCAVYEVRPLACRAYHSLDASSCKYSFDNPTDDNERCPCIEELDSVWHTMTGLANGVFSQNHYDRTGYELGSALLEALTAPAASRRFYLRKKALNQARCLYTPIPFTE